MKKKINSLAIIIDLKQILNSPKYADNFFEDLAKYQGNNLNRYVIDMSNIFTLKKNTIKFKYQPLIIYSLGSQKSDCKMFNCY